VLLSPRPQSVPGLVGISAGRPYRPFAQRNSFFLRGRYAQESGAQSELANTEVLFENSEEVFIYAVVAG
jgi:hypothetical protein